MAHILIIDDEPQIRFLLRRLLESEHYTVIEASDGKEGIARYQENQVDLVITDLIMPDKEGLETILEMKKKYPDIKIIAMSGGGINHSDSYLKMAEQFGATETFKKPVRKEALLKAIKKMV